MAKMPEVITSQDILTPVQAGKILGVCADTIYQMCDSGKLPHVRLGNRRRIPGWLLMEWLHKSGEHLGLCEKGGEIANVRTTAKKNI